MATLENIQDQNSFSHSTKHVSQTFPVSQNSAENPTADIHMVQFKNKIILNIRYNGEMDTTFRVPLSDRTYLSNIVSQTSTEQESKEDHDYDKRHGLSKQQMISSAEIEVVCLAGVTSGRLSVENIKLRVLASQIMILLVSINKYESRDILLSVSSKFFRKPHFAQNYNDNQKSKENSDFNILVFLLKLIKEAYL